MNMSKNSVRKGRKMSIHESQFIRIYLYCNFSYGLIKFKKRIMFAPEFFQLDSAITKYMYLYIIQVSGSKLWQTERSCMCCQESGEREATVQLFCPKASADQPKYRKVIAK